MLWNVNGPADVHPIHPTHSVGVPVQRSHVYTWTTTASSLASLVFIFTSVPGILLALGEGVEGAELLDGLELGGAVSIKPF